VTTTADDIAQRIALELGSAQGLHKRLREAGLAREDDLWIHCTADYRQRMEIMVGKDWGLSDSLEAAQMMANQEGYEQGHESGFEMGYRKGLAEGHKAGAQEGYAKGYEFGRKEGPATEVTDD